MESKKYITSKSKTFKEDTYMGDIAAWVIDNVESKRIINGLEVKFHSTRKYKITITNLK